MTHPLAIARSAVYQHRAIQKAPELAGYLALVMDLDPLETVVEVGSDAGGTLWAWQQICQRVIGVDLPRAGFSSGTRLNSHGCEIVAGDSHDPATRERLEDLLDGDLVDMLFIDGDHTYDGVKNDFDVFAPLVRPGGVIGFHDICDHITLPYVQVREFWYSLLGRKEEFVVWPNTWGGIGALHVPAEADELARWQKDLQYIQASQYAFSSIPKIGADK